MQPETLQLDLQELPFDFQELGFGGDASEEDAVDFGKLRDMTDDSDGEYQDFVDKFKPKSATDDCFTPEPVYNAVRDADGAQRRADVFQRPHFELPANAVNAARFRHGSDIRIPKDQCSFTRALDSQKEQGKALFGGASS